MRRTVLHIVLLLMVGVPLVYAGSVVLSRFEARTVENDIIVTWQASVESDVREYVLERKTQFDADFVEMAHLTAQGANVAYTFTDARVYKVQAEQVYYRLRIVHSDNTVTLTDAISVNYTPTAVRRTWGSIKAMFQ